MTIPSTALPRRIRVPRLARGAVVLLLALAGMTVAAAPSVAKPAAAAYLPGTINLPCAGTTLHRAADWYLPVTPPRGLVWVQHGFARTEKNVAALSTTLADAGYLVFAPSLPFLDPHGCTLQNLGGRTALGNTAFLDGLAQLFATAIDPGGALSSALRAAAAQAGRPAPTMPRELVFVGHSAGAEAAEYVAYRMHTAFPADRPALRGLVVLDPVTSFLGDNTEVALSDLDHTALPILTVSGAPGPCNNFGSGTTALQQRLHRDFVGVRLPTGEHTDAEGRSSDALGELICGTPQSANVAALQRLTTGWTGDFFDGTRTSSDYPAGPSGAVAAAPGAQPLHGG